MAVTTEPTTRLGSGSSARGVGIDVTDAHAAGDAPQPPRADPPRRRVALDRTGRARRDRRSQRCRQDHAPGDDGRRRPSDGGLGPVRRRRCRRLPQRARLRPAGRHHPRRPRARTHAPVRGPTPPALGDDDGRDRPRRRRHSGGRRPDGSRRRSRGLAERRAAQAGQHRRRAAHRSAGVLPRRADLGTRSGHERRADAPPAHARRPVSDGRVHDPLGRGSRGVRPDRLPGARRPTGVRRYGRRGSPGLRRRLRRRPLSPPRRWVRLDGTPARVGDGDHPRPPRASATGHRGGPRAGVRNGPCSPRGHSRRSCGTG